MPSNVEIKARVADVERLKRLAGELCDEGPTVIKQVDTFFHVPNGRLKLRQLQEEKSQLIFYDRDDQAGPKCSEFFTHHTDNPDSLQVVLSKALGVKGEGQEVSSALYGGSDTCTCG
ncbi:hypothetical protein DPMN_018344 [Dreissena polymorpha]|uniref:CYTH domain-containing protein n=1 Tax=Dreissena polymorpha TaxID=45954 RepID=A0A9D4ND13_DREPO|nr:hypothetical protein DPMN_018344 [Dreissena polymorpha]